MKIYITLIAALLQLSVACAGTNNVSAAIFIKNAIGVEYAEKTEVLKSMLVARLTSAGFNIVDKEDVIRSVNDFEKNNKLSHADKKLLEQYLDFHEGIPGISVQKYALFKDMKKSDIEHYDILDDASILRLSQMMNCDYFIGATLTSFNKNKKKFNGYGIEQEITEFVLRVSLKLADAVNDGGSVYGDTVIVTKKIAQNENLKIEHEDVFDEMLDEASAKISDNISVILTKLQKPISSEGATFSVTSDVPGSVVELDGAVLGSTPPGRFTVKPGIHTIRVSKPRYITWERRINVYPQQVLNVSMVKSDIGLSNDREETDISLDKSERLSDIDSKEKIVDVAVYVEKKDADSREKVAEGVKERESSSYMKIEGAPPTVIYDRDRDVNTINVIEK